MKFQRDRHVDRKTPRPNDDDYERALKEQLPRPFGMAFFAADL